MKQTNEKNQSVVKYKRVFIFFGDVQLARKQSAFYENCLVGILVHLRVIKRFSKKCKKVTIFLLENTSNMQYLIGRRK